MAEIRKWIADGAPWPEDLRADRKKERAVVAPSRWRSRGIPRVESQLGAHADRRLRPGEAEREKLTPSPEADRPR